MGSYFDYYLKISDDEPEVCDPDGRFISLLH